MVHVTRNVEDITDDLETVLSSLNVKYIHVPREGHYKCRAELAGARFPFSIIRLIDGPYRVGLSRQVGQVPRGFASLFIDGIGSGLCSDAGKCGRLYLYCGGDPRAASGCFSGPNCYLKVHASHCCGGFIVIFVAIPLQYISSMG